MSFGATGISLNCQNGFGVGYGISEQGTYKTIDLVGAEAWLLRGISFGATGISLNCRSGFGAGYGISEQGTYKTSDLVGAEALLLRGLS
ncbi:uncharacterized protein [Nicotiana tomentosiformis]|uniref:uncharacterized protein isoform X4 n=1 Tax=Nicotiana tomentosiformis TaxID=4098 RepID=UPI00388CC60B